MTGCCSYQEGVYCVQISGHPPEPGQSIHLYQVIRIAGFDLASRAARLEGEFYCFFSWQDGTKGICALGEKSLVLGLLLEIFP